MNPKLVGTLLFLMGAIATPPSAIELQQGLAAKAATPISWAKFSADPPKAGWFKLSGAQLDMTGALYVDDNGQVGNIYVPVRAAGSELDPESQAPISVLVRVADAKSRRFVEDLNKIPEKATTQALTFLEQHKNDLQVKRPMEGTIADGLDALDDKDKNALQRAEANLSPDFVILQEGVTPSIGGRFLMLIFGAAMVLGGIAMFFQKPK